MYCAVWFSNLVSPEFAVGMAATVLNTGPATRDAVTSRFDYAHLAGSHMVAVLRHDQPEVLDRDQHLPALLAGVPS